MGVGVVVGAVECRGEEGKDKSCEGTVEGGRLRRGRR